MRHPAVAETAVVARPDEKYGETVAAFVRLEPGAGLSLPDVIEHFRAAGVARQKRSEAHTSELQSLMRISYAVFCLKKKKIKKSHKITRVTSAMNSYLIIITH